MREFRWVEWNVDHIAKHGITPQEAEYVVRFPDRGYPRRQSEGRWLVKGQTPDGCYIQVVYAIRKNDSRIFVIHSRPLTETKKRAMRRRRP